MQTLRFFYSFYVVCLINLNIFIHCQQPPLNQYQLFSTWKTDIGTPISITSSNKFNTPVGTSMASRAFTVSTSRFATKRNHPSGQELFPGNGGLAGELNNFLSAINQDDYFLVYFSRIHLIYLHQLYSYLMKIYTTFNMTVTKDIIEYLRNEQSQALNKKTHIINHFIAIIESQSNQAITNRMPALPQHLATYVGNTMYLKHDYGADLNLLIENQELNVITFDPATDKPEEKQGVLDVQKSIREMRINYLGVLGKYLLFFKNYTGALEQPDAQYNSLFVRYAYDIQKIMAARTPTVDKSSLAQQIQTLRDIQLINPPMFLYDDETIRGIKVIIKTAQTFGPTTIKVPWPAQVIKDAQTGALIKDQNGIVISNNPAAYFVDAGGSRSLYVNIPTVDHMYSQEILPQPDWLNSAKGITLMLRACLGDFTALLDPLFEKELILDPCLRCIIMNAAINAGIMGQSARTQQICTECESYLNALQKLIKEQEADQEAPPPPPDISQLPPP